MTDDYDLLLSKAFTLFAKKNINHFDIQSLMPEKKEGLCLLERYKPNYKLIKSDTNASHVYILLKGKVKCIVDSYLGERKIIDVISSPYVFGLLEYMIDLKKYSASIVTFDKETWILSAPIDVFIHAIKNNITVSNMCLSFFTSVAFYYMDIAGILSYDTLYKIIVYIHKYCDKSSLPYKIDVTRKTMGHILDINLRTLYRYLKKLEKENYFNIVGGKIFINAEQYKKLIKRSAKYSKFDSNLKQIYAKLFNDSK